MNAAAGGALALVVLFYGSIVAIVIGLTVLWVYAIVDCAQREFPGPNDKIVWILIIIFAHGIGALIYWIVGRPRGVRSG